MTKKSNSYYSIADQLFHRADDPIVVMPNGLSKTFPSFLVRLGKSNEQYNGSVAFHYTRKEIWPLIFGNLELWMTDYKFLLDPAEGIYGISLFYNLLTNDISLMSGEDLDSAFQRLRKWLETGLNSSDHFVASLSIEGDDLGLWREYSKQGGVALGVPLDAVIKYASTQKHLSVNYVIYDENSQLEAIRPILRIFKAELLRQANKPLEPMSVDLSKELFKVVLRLKHPAYAYEKEVRIVSTAPVEGVHYRGVSSRRVRYTKLSLKKCLDEYGKNIPYFPSIFASPGLKLESVLNVATEISQEKKFERDLCNMVTASAIPMIWE